MAKFLVVLALASMAAAIDHPGSLGIGYNYPGIGVGGVSKQYTSVGTSVGGYHPGDGVGIGVSKQVTSVGGYPYDGLGVGGVGVSKQVTSVGGYPYDGLGVGGVGVSKQVTSVGGYPYDGIGIGGVGVSKQFSTVGHGIGPGFAHGIAPGYAHGIAPGYSHGIGHGYAHGIGQGIGYPMGIGGVGVSKQISSYGHTLGGIGAVKSSHINSVSHYGGLGLGGLAPTYGPITSISSVNRLSVPAVSTIPGGYYGGIIAYPQALPTAVSANALHIPGAAVDTYRGYYAGYFPGSIGYGSSYRFFH